MLFSDIVHLDSGEHFPDVESPGHNLFLCHYFTSLDQTKIMLG